MPVVAVAVEPDDVRLFGHARQRVDDIVTVLEERRHLVTGVDEGEDGHFGELIPQGEREGAGEVRECRPGAADVAENHELWLVWAVRLVNGRERHAATRQ